MITTNATVEVQKELETFIEAYEEQKLTNFEWVKGGYRNAVVKYELPNNKKQNFTLKRIDGNWRIVPKSSI